MTFIRIAEVFGPTFQGEGPSAGRHTAFVRLWGCNLDCSWCDTPYTWDTTGKNGTAYPRQANSTVRPVDSVVDEAIGLALRIERVVITGGEPLVQRGALEHLVAAFLERDIAVEIETNGTLAPLDVQPVQYNVSPKLSGAGVDTMRSLKVGVLEQYAAIGANYKFVITTTKDYAQVETLVRALNLDPSRVWLMPEGRTTRDILERAQRIAPYALAAGYNLSLRTHVLLWGDERGR